jgi:hypothetical protein
VRRQGSAKMMAVCVEQLTDVTALIGGWFCRRRTRGRAKR